MGYKVRVKKFTKGMVDTATSDFMRMSLKERAALVQSMAVETRRRALQFRSHGLYSPALEKLEEHLAGAGFEIGSQYINKETGRIGKAMWKSSEKAKSGRLLMAFESYKHFLNPIETKTNTVKGIYDWRRRMDEMVFGSEERFDKKTGKVKVVPKGKFKSNKQRKAFWDMVNTVRSSDVVDPASHYFFQKEGFMQVWTSSKFQRMSVEDQMKWIWDSIQEAEGEVPPIQPSELGGEDVEAVNDDTAVAYLAEEFRRRTGKYN